MRRTPKQGQAKGGEHEATLKGCHVAEHRAELKVLTAHLSSAPVRHIAVGPDWEEQLLTTLY